MQQQIQAAARELDRLLAPRPDSEATAEHWREQEGTGVPRTRGGSLFKKTARGERDRCV